MRTGVTLLDGATGTYLWKLAEEKGYAKDPVWKYNVEHPELVSRLAKDYIAAGAEIILANTFGANGPAVSRSSGYSVAQVVGEGVRLAKEAAAGTDVKVALDIGPLTVMMEPYGDLTEEEAEEIFREQIGAGMSEDPDLVILETFMDLEMLKVAARVAKSYGVPVLCTMTFEARGRTMMGNSVEDIVEELTELGVDGLGLNCSLGPVDALPLIRAFAEATDLPLVFKPNAGLPTLDENGHETAAYSAQTFVSEVEPALELVRFVGGCCGSDPEYIRALRARLAENA
ncbi:MAG: homocysteine S-methyltransferase family protein [Oscillospiraceae bacterium]|nr:homocysteine S-methyltransferase family protein [Oscillospiraceae bacterium]